MLKLKKRMNLRVSDRIAVAAALVLTVSALGGVVAEQNREDLEPVTPRVLKAQAADPQSDDAVERHGAKARLLLFRRG